MCLYFLIFHFFEVFTYCFTVLLRSLYVCVCVIVFKCFVMGKTSAHKQNRPFIKTMCNYNNVILTQDAEYESHMLKRWVYI